LSWNLTNNLYVTSKTTSHKYSYKTIKKNRLYTSNLKEHIKIREYRKSVESQSITLLIWTLALMISANNLYQSRRKVIDSKVETNKIQSSRNFLNKTLKIRFLKDKLISEILWNNKKWQKFIQFRRIFWNKVTKVLWLVLQN
jgi:hypothetical protein